LRPKDVPMLRNPRYSQSLERGLATLGCFTTKHPQLGIIDIADELGMSRSTVHRYVITLVALGYLEQDASRKYRLGLRVTDLGMAALGSTGLREHSRSSLEALRDRSSFTVSVAVLYGRDILYIDRVRSYRRGQHMIDLNLRAGSRLPAYCTSMGKLLLAYLPDREQRKLIGEVQLTQHGPKSLKSKTALRTELEQIREAGLAINDEEFAEGLYSIAAPIRDASTAVAAAINMAVYAPIISLEDFVDGQGPHLLATADHISSLLGYRANDRAG
jgi:IclR family transcriptional regulator, pca regulon regulatory protein